PRRAGLSARTGGAPDTGLIPRRPPGRAWPLRIQGLPLYRASCPGSWSAVGGQAGESMVSIVGSLLPAHDPSPAPSGSRSAPPAARAETAAFGPDAYPTLDENAAALLHSLARNHALVDGNKRLALAGLLAFYGVNGRRLILTNDAAYELVMAIAAGDLDTVAE